LIRQSIYELVTIAIRKLLPTNAQSTIFNSDLKNEPKILLSPMK
jgi:hypothetical protein